MKVTCTYIEAHIIIYEFVHQVPNEIFTMSRFYLLQFYKMILKVVDYRVVEL